MIPNADQSLKTATTPSRSSSRDKSVPRAASNQSMGVPHEGTPKRSPFFESGEDTDLVEYFSDERYRSTSRQHQKKRRKKQKTTEQAPTSQQKQQPREDVIAVDDTDSAASRDLQTSGDQAPAGTITRFGRRAEVVQYESALKTRGYRAQLLKDVDLNLLRSLAEIAFRQAALEYSNQRSEEVQQERELKRFAHRILVARNCLSYTIARIVGWNGDSSNPDAIDTGIDTVSFVSTGQCRLMLMQDIERYVLRLSKTIRQFTFGDRDNPRAHRVEFAK